MGIYSIQFWKDATERAVKTAAQTAATAFGGDVFHVWSADWKAIAGAAVGGLFLSYLTSLGSSGIGDTGSPSLVGAFQQRRGGGA